MKRLEYSKIPTLDLEKLRELIAGIPWRDSVMYTPDMQHSYILKIRLPTYTVNLDLLSPTGVMWIISKANLITIW